MAFPQTSDLASDHYQPWLVADQTKDTLLPVDADAFDPSTFLDPKAFSATGFASIYSHDASRTTPGPAFDDAAEGIKLSPSPQQVKPNQNTWAFGTYCNSSPSSSPYSSGDSRTFSELQSATASWASPDLSLGYSSHSSPDHHAVDHTIAQSIEMGPFGSCSLSDVQHFTEPESDLLAFDQFNGCMPTFQQPTFPSLDLSSINTSQFSYNTSPPGQPWALSRRSSQDSDLDYTPICPTRGRQRKASNSISSIYSTSTAASRVSKSRAPSLVPSRRGTPFSSYSKSCSPARFAASRATPGPAATSNFPCPLAPYGCTSSFGSKNEWKRHVNTQHLRLDLWRCDQCPDRDTRPNDFNRKDLFIQHLRRMHHKPGTCSSSSSSPSHQHQQQHHHNHHHHHHHSHSHSSSVSSAAELARSSRARSFGSAGGASGASSEEADPAIGQAEQRCHIKLRQAPDSSCCLFCDARFEGPGSWEERMEHVGRHLEMDKKEGREAPAVDTWRRDEGFEAWCEREGLIVRTEQGGWGVGEGRRTR